MNEVVPSALQTAVLNKVVSKALCCYTYTVKGQYWREAATLLVNFSVRQECAQPLDAEIYHGLVQGLADSWHLIFSSSVFVLILGDV